MGVLASTDFYASLLPVFVNLSTLQASDILIIISVMVISLGSVKILYAFSAIKMVAFATGKKLDNVSRKTAGCLMFGAGGYLIVKA